MLGMFMGSIAKAAVAVVTLPVAAVVDVAEAVGIAEDEGKNHTGEALQAVVKNLQEAVE